MTSAKFKLTLFLCLSTILIVGSGCSSKDAETSAQDSARSASMGGDEEFADFEDDYVEVSDPLEPVNRAVFAFNDKAYDWVLEPIASGYKKVTPEPVRKGIGNFFENLAFPIRLVNSALQGKFGRAGQETGKFFVNTTVGVFGFIKVSDDIDGLADVPSEDLGQTLGVWGVPNGPYLVIPILGPSTIRDAVGSIGDPYLHPYAWTEHVWDDWEWEIEWSLQTIELINDSPDLIERYEMIEEIAVDPYISMRDAYFQNRKRETER
ncbi:MAG: VacJ family lipoprotein [Verrucomicrobiota bacterium]